MHGTNKEDKSGQIWSSN